MKRVYIRTYIKIEIDETNGILVRTWLSYTTSKEFRKGQLLTIKFFQKYNCIHFISDTSKSGVISETDLDWAAKVITPQLIESGMKTLNFVIPEGNFGKLAVRNYEELDKATNQTPICYHSNIKLAIEAVLKEVPV